MPSNRGKKSTGKAARAGGSQANADDWEALKGLALLFGFFKWCGFAAWGVCLLSQSLAWPWFVIAIAAWVAASWTRRRSDRAYERRYGPIPTPAPYVPVNEERPRRSLSTMESMLIGALLGGLFFGGSEDDE